MSAAALPRQPEAPEPASDALLQVEDLKTVFHTEVGIVHAVDGVSFEVNSREVLAIVGESGCGKTVTALSIMGLLPRPAGQIVGGSIRYRGRDMVRMHPEERRAMRGDRIAMIFQDPLTALNPVHRVGAQIAELMLAHRDISRRDAWARAVELLKLVGIPSAGERARDYPHQFSGGMRQRVMIAMAIALDPDLLIADEPTTALDVTVQAQIMDLLAEIQEERRMGLILITHDLGVVAEVADRIAVMYAGRIVEHADARSLYASPGHPYTAALLESLPRLDQKGETLYTIKGLPPSLLNIPSGCPFHPRCRRAQDVCRSEVPRQVRLGLGRTSACHFAEEVIASGGVHS